MKSFIFTITMLVLCASVCLLNYDNMFTDMLGVISLVLALFLTWFIAMFTDVVRNVEDHDITLKDMWTECIK